MKENVSGYFSATPCTFELLYNITWNVFK